MFENDVKRVDDAGHVAKDREQDVQPEVAGHANFKENTDGWQKNRKYNFDRIGGGKSHANLKRTFLYTFRDIRISRASQGQY